MPELAWRPGNKEDNTKKVKLLYRGPGIYDVKGSVHVFFEKLHHKGERGGKKGSAKFQNKAHRTFDIIIT